MIIDLSTRIQYLREKNGLTQTALAKMLGISRSAVNGWEMGLSLPSLANIVEMSRIFHVTVDYLLNISDKMLLDISDLGEAEKDALFRIVDCLKAR